MECHYIRMKWLLLLSVLVYTVLARRHHYHYHVDTTPHVTAPLPTTSPPSVVSERDRRHGDAITNVLYTKHQPGRHVCTTQHATTQPVKTIETYCKPAYQQYKERCNSNQICHGVRLVYQTAYRDVVKMKTTHHTTYVCCSGWTQITKISHGCNKPSCSADCHNGGTCVKPNVCTCPKGFKGKQCELDVNECKEQKPCDHICHNTEGSFFCQCRENFTLQPDAQSCKKEGEEGPAFEAKDLEFELLNKRIVDLEKMMGNEVFHDVNDTFILNELKKRVDTLTSNLTQLENRMDGVEESQREISTIKEKLNSLERNSNKISNTYSYNKHLYP